MTYFKKRPNTVSVRSKYIAKLFFINQSQRSIS